MRARVEAFEWADTPLGPRDRWCNELQIMVAQVLDSGFPQAIMWGPELILIYNDAFLPILGNKHDTLGNTFSDVWSEVWDQIRPIADRAFAGASTYIEDFPLLINRTGRPEEAYFTFCYSPLRLADGSVGGILDTVVETTSTVLARNDLALANGELSHRLKNTLTMVQAIAGQTFRENRESKELESFSQRLIALSHAHDVLLSQNWTSVSLQRLIRDTLIAQESAHRIDVEGSDFRIGSRSAMAISMMLHELATNAIKYGALSLDSGSVTITCSRQQGNLAVLEWRESGGPRLDGVPQRRGFGSRLIDRGLGYGSQVTRDYAPEGLTVTLSADLEEWRH